MDRARLREELYGPLRQPVAEALGRIKDINNSRMDDFPEAMDEAKTHAAAVVALEEKGRALGDENEPVADAMRQFRLRLPTIDRLVEALDPEADESLIARLEAAKALVEVRDRMAAEHTR